MIKITSHRPSSSSSIPEYEKLKIKVPFPPDIKAVDLVRKRKTFERSMKPSNAFIIYRGQYLKQLHRLGFKPDMIQISKNAGRAWKAEPNDVKNWYVEFAEVAGKMMMQEHMRFVALDKKNWVEWNGVQRYKARPIISESQKSKFSKTTQNNHLIKTPEASSLSSLSRGFEYEAFNNSQKTREFYQNWPNVNVTDNSNNYHQYYNHYTNSVDFRGGAYTHYINSLSSSLSNQNHLMFLSQQNTSPPQIDNSELQTEQAFSFSNTQITETI
ncbi:7383_t:CDS:1 [Ambispora leptoticha]|uniref:7383_t:CDS:1 n=1 Tax=Ambispora leptoticha TaxID=144679 RepID=A0A9N9B7Y5_9GLOM|nr:7383_t:CDS:1 [Ambispora leptoticha]